MKTLKKLLVVSIISLVPIHLFAFDTFITPPSTKTNLSSPLASKTKEKKQFPYKQILSFYPTKAIANYIMVGYERQIGTKHVLKIAAGYANFEEQNISTGFNNEIKEFSGTRFDMMFKYFMGKDVSMFNGIYFAPYLSFKSSNFKYENFTDFGPSIWEEGSASALATGFVFGLQVPLGNTFCADLYVGNALINCSGNYKEATRFMDSYRNSIGLISGFSFGFGF
jgi:hypothetical protein